ncbi:MAG: DUF3343 domain-containing protein [Bacillota bacterium]|nr:DUF3343 domain-containing protein [Bacillota bacterium]
MIWPGKKKKQQHNKNIRGRGLVLFDTVEDAIRAEKILHKQQHQCRLVAPPPSRRRGCDLALEINLIEQAIIERLLSERVPYIVISPLTGTTELLNIIKTYNYGDYTMVKAGNMKVTFENATGIIVNTSGGGCPDIPYLHLELVGHRLDQIPRPKEIGHTLCALMLDRAVEGALELWEGGRAKCS